LMNGTDELFGMFMSGVAP